MFSKKLANLVTFTLEKYTYENFPNLLSKN